MNAIVGNIVNINPPQTENSISQKESQQKGCSFVASINKIGKQMREGEQQEDLKKKEVIQGNSQNETPTDSRQSASSGGEEAVSEEEAPKEQVKKQMQNVFSELLGKMEASDVSSTTPSQQLTQSNISPAPPKQSTVPRSKSSPLP